jgi:hypothetical protein
MVPADIFLWDRKPGEPKPVPAERMGDDTTEADILVVVVLMGNTDIKKEKEEKINL